MNKVIGLNVHVDTFEGMRHGVPRLLRLFAKYAIHVTFFVPMGKDHTGRTILRALRRPGLLLKAQRGNAVGAYGIKTLMRGILLPGPEIAKKHRELLRLIVDSGHELGIHGLDHVYWHDHIKYMDQAGTEKTLAKAAEVYESLLGAKPRSFAAPGWMINRHALAFFEEHDFAYTTDTRGTSPFFPRMGSRMFSVMQLPLTMPTLDEIIGLEGHDSRTLSGYFCDRLTAGLNILAVHTEFEGNRWTPFLDSFIEQSIGRGYHYERLIDLAEKVRAEGNVSVNDCTYGFVRGRATEVTLQGAHTGLGHPSGGSSLIT
jgi:undecaprenyl phosphate-alpha-L-ara4FN deformylase